MPKGTCSVDGCQRAAYAKGFCVSHYHQARRQGIGVGLCKLEGCERPKKAAGWCEMHWRRWRRTGDPGPVETQSWTYYRNQSETVEDRFWSKVDKSGICWRWTGSTNTDGYGRFSTGPRATVSAHRFAYEAVVGPIPDGLVIDHLCRNRGCVNPAHLQPVTDRVNVLRGVGPAAVNVFKTHCPRGHPYDEANTYRHPRGNRVCVACRDAAKRRRAG